MGNDLDNDAIDNELKLKTQIPAMQSGTDVRHSSEVNVLSLAITPTPQNNCVSFL